MEKLKLKLVSCRRALTTLAEVLAMPYDIIVRDAAIQRFEYTFETVWKLQQVYLREREGIICNSPKSCFRQASRVGLFSPEEAETCLEMTNDRNLTEHTYVEQIAEAIFQKLPAYLIMMQTLLADIQARI